MKRPNLLAGLACVLLAAPALAQAPANDKPAENPVAIPMPQEEAVRHESDEVHYERCLKLALEKPVQAYEDALDWESRHGGPAAKHCVASALLGMGDYLRAAERLEDLGYAPEWINNSVRVGIFQQSGDAFLQAREPERAVKAYDGGLKLAMGNPDLLLGRARALVMLGKDEKAVDALDGALQAQPDNVPALILHADALIRLTKLAKAQPDVDHAMRLAPKSVDVLLLRGRFHEAQRLAGQNQGQTHESH